MSQDYGSKTARKGKGKESLENRLRVRLASGELSDDEVLGKLLRSTPVPFSPLQLIKVPLTLISASFSYYSFYSSISIVAKANSSCEYFVFPPSPSSFLNDHPTL